jgi:hypothetical protein
MSTPNGIDHRVNPDTERTVQLTQRPRSTYAAPSAQRPPAGPAFTPPAPQQWPTPAAAAWPQAQAFEQHGNGYPPAGWAPVSPQPNKSRRNLVILAVVSVIAVIAVIVTVVMASGSDSSEGNGGGKSAPSKTTTTSTTPKPAPPKKAIAPSSLQKLMLNDSELSEAVGATMIPGRMWSTPANVALVDDECVPVALPGSAKLYRASAFTGIQMQSADSVTKEPRTSQAAVAFPSDEAAANFVKNEGRAAWERCANRTVNFQSVDPKNPMDVSWDIGAVSDVDGLMTVTRGQVGSTSGWGCHQGMTSRRNVVFEISVCGRGIVDSTLTAVVDQFEKKVARQK